MTHYNTLLAALTIISIAVGALPVSAQGLSVSPLSGSPSYTYPISSRTVDGATINFSLHWTGNVTQKRFLDYKEYLAGPAPGVPTGRWYWDTRTRQHGAWLFSVNGIAVQSLNSVYFRWDEEGISESWLTEGYDFCNRMVDLTSSEQLRDVIRLLRSDGSVIELQNEVAANTLPADDAGRYTGRYYEHGVNAHGWALVELDDRYYPDAFKEVIDADGQPALKYHPRRIRYYPGDGLEYVFREDIFPYGTYSEASTDARDVAFTKAGPTIFLLEAIVKDHNVLTTFTYSKHHAADDYPEASPGRPLLERFDGHRLSYGEGLVTVEALGSTHQLLVWDQTFFNPSDYYTDLTPFWSNWDISSRTRTGLLWRYDETNTGGLTAPDAYGAVREIISHSRGRTQFRYKKRSGVNNSVLFDAFILKLISTASGSEVVSYHDESSMSYNEPNRSYYTGRLLPEEQNVVSKVERRTPNGTLVSETTFDYVNAISFAGIPPATRKTWFTTTDHVTASLDKKTTIDTYYWDSVAVDEFAPVTTDPYRTDDLIHLWLRQQTIQTGDRFVDHVYDEYLPVATNRFLRLIRSVETWETDGLQPAAYTLRSSFKYRTSLTEHGHHDPVTLTNGLLTTAARDAFQTLISKTIDTVCIPNTGAPFTVTETRYHHLDFAEFVNVSIKDTSVNDYWTRRGLDSLHTSGVATAFRSIATPASAVARTVRATPLYGIPYQIDRYAPGGVFLGGVETEIQTLYTGTAGLPTVPRGSAKVMHVLGQSLTGNRIDAPRIDSLVTVSYVPSYYRNRAISVRTKSGAELVANYDLSTPAATLFGTEATAMGSVTLSDQDFLSDAPSSVTARSRYYDPLVFMTGIGVQSLTTTSGGTYDGRMQTVIDANGYLSAARVRLDTSVQHAWTPGSFPEGWEASQPEIRLWKAETQRQIIEDVKTCGSNTVTSTALADVYDPERLILMSSHELPWSVCDGTTQIRQRWTSSVGLTYVASDDDNLHDEATVNIAVVRVVLTDYDFCIADQVDIDVVWTWGTSNTNTQNLQLLWDHHTDRAGDSTRYAVVELPIPAEVFDSMRTSAAGTEFELSLAINEESVGFIAFATHAEDVAPRIVCRYQPAAPAAPVMPDATVADFTVQSTILDQGLRQQSTSKLDDAATTETPSWSASDPVRYDGRYLTNVGIWYPDQLKSVSIPMRGNPFLGTLLDSSRAYYDATGSIRSVKNALDISTSLALHPTGTDTLTWPDNNQRISHDSLDTPMAFGIPAGEIADYMGVCRKSIAYDENGVPITTYADAWGRIQKQVVTSSMPLTTKTRYDQYGRHSETINPAGQQIVLTYDAFNRVRTLQHPDQGLTEYRYDPMGRLRFMQTPDQRVDPENVFVTYYQYDDLNRIAQVGVCKLGEEETIDDLDSSIINDNQPQTLPFSRTPMMTPVQAPPQFDASFLEEGQCYPDPAQSRPDYEQYAYPVGQALVRNVGVTPPLNPADVPPSTPNFEDLVYRPYNARMVYLYDALPTAPLAASAVWSQLKLPSWWGAMAPTGTVRNTKGRVAAVAYRDDGNQEWWYQVYSYNEQGLLEAVMRFNDNLPYDATWYDYDNAGNIVKIRSIDPIRHHTTWYAYDVEGRVEKIWSALSPEGDAYGLSVGFGTNPSPSPRYSAITWTARPQDPDVVYGYDALDRLVTKTYPNVDGLGRAVEQSLTFNSRGMLTDAVVADPSAPPVYSDESYARDNTGRITQRAVTAPPSGETWDVTYDDAGHIIDHNDQTDLTLWVVDEVVNRRDIWKNWLHRYEYEYLSPSTPNGITGVDPVVPTVDPSVTSTFDAAGRTVTRTVTVPSGAGFTSSTETYAYGYHGKTTSMRLNIATGLIGCVPTYPLPATFAPEQVWTYRYGPNGVREQRRLMMSPLHDSAGCTGVLPWTYYVNDPSGLVLAVYHGRQMKRSHLGDGCPDPPTPPTEPTRRVFIYPVEYRSYGPDGVNVVYERENYGVNAGQWVKRYLTTDYQGTVLQAHDVNGDHEQHYELFGAEKGQVARRTGWLDREIDWESSPLTDLYRTVDLVNRKYDPQRGVFLTSDPLWMMSADASSYHYAYHDPMNMIDPWGLSGEATNSGNPSAGGDDVGSGGGVDVGPSNKDEQQDPSINWADVFVQDLMRGVYLRGVGVGALPGVGIGGGGLGPVGGGNGKTDPSASGSAKWAGVPYRSDVTKWSQFDGNGVRKSPMQYTSVKIDVSRVNHRTATISTPSHQRPDLHAIPLICLIDDIWVTTQRFMPWVEPNEITHFNHRYATDSERMGSFINVGTSVFSMSRTLLQGKSGMVFPTKPMWFHSPTKAQFLPRNNWIRFGSSFNSGTEVLSLKLGAGTKSYLEQVPVMLRPVNKMIRFHLDVFPW